MSYFNLIWIASSYLLAMTLFCWFALTLEGASLRGTKQSSFLNNITIINMQN